LDQPLISKIVNAILSPFGLKISRKTMPATLAAASAPPEGKAFDAVFRSWIEDAKRKGRDPNDVGDEDWADDPLEWALENIYLPHIQLSSVVLELGPGTGRMSRKLAGKCKELILVDHSIAVCEFLGDYMKGKCQHRVLHIDRPIVGALGGRSVDVVVANGVFEHLDPEETYSFLEEFYRLLVPGGWIAFNFDNILSEEGLIWLRQHRGKLGSRCLFRFYTPEMMARIAEATGFETPKIRHSQSRMAYLEAQKSLSS
jgi:SAM-dependent methyltransferase